jgi:L-alanine-DL-glutamate epimerase-like enolase superfamily enzyme
LPPSAIGYGPVVHIARVSCHRHLQPFVDGPYVLSGDRVDVGFDSLVVRIATDAGVVGWGEMSPLGTMYDPAFADGAFAAAPLLAGALVGQSVDFHHWVTVSNGSGLPPTDDGILRPPIGAGLGIDVDEAGLGCVLVDEGD